jgi:hypothetical protein
MKVSATSCRFSSSDQRRRACPRKISIRAIHSPQRLVSQPLQDQSQRQASPRPSLAQGGPYRTGTAVSAVRPLNHALHPC